MDPYGVLDVSRDCSEEELKRAYRTKVFSCHPDTNPHLGEEGIEQFRKVTEAYEMLRDKEKRKNVDRWMDENSFSGSSSEGYPYGFRGKWQEDQFWKDFEKRFYRESNHYWRKGMEEEKRRQQEQERRRWWEEEKAEAEENRARFFRQRSRMAEARYGRIYHALQSKWMASRNIVWQDVVYSCLAGALLVGLGLANKSRLDRQKARLSSADPCKG